VHCEDDRYYCWLQPMDGGSLGRTTDGARAEEVEDAEVSSGCASIASSASRLLMRPSSAKTRMNSSISIPFESSASKRWKTLSNASLVPSSCRMCCGSPSSARTCGERRAPW
jgi:hypothetical protein